jgi:hypothetical protein
VNIKPSFFKKSNSSILKLEESIHIVDSYFRDREFIFLNLSIKFKKKIDWNYSNNGKLWTYNLTYFDFLSQKNQRDNNLALIGSFINNIDNLKDGLEPFPISLRGINWIKYLTYSNIKNQRIDDSLYGQYYILLNNIEYHLLGNHLLENGFSLLFGSYYFQDNRLYEKAKEILVEELEEQILNDGGHFELSPMYHQIMLFRVLDSINLIKHNSWKNGELLGFLRGKGELMLGWIDKISYKNGDIPLLNDSTNHIAPTTEQLINYSKSLNLKIYSLRLNESGYRKVLNDNYECIVDIGNIGAEYIAGHAHADCFNFELRFGDKPFIVDTGLSTYETSPRRDIERSTISHNTVEVNDKNQSETWGGFRVANRARVIDIKEKDGVIEATHDGYKPILHTRKWYFGKDKVTIEDNLDRDAIGIARLHFHPDISKDYILKHIEISTDDWKFDKYNYSCEFNLQVEANLIEIRFRYNLIVNLFY